MPVLQKQQNLVNAYDASFAKTAKLLGGLR
jgi:hypothetical protein